MKKTLRRLRLDRETVRNLTPDNLESVAGGLNTEDSCVNSCDPTGRFPPAHRLPRSDRHPLLSQRFPRAADGAALLSCPRGETMETALVLPAEAAAVADALAAETYVVSRSLMLQLDPRGFWQGTNSVSRSAQRVGDDALPVLAAFARPRSVRDVFAELREEWDVDEAGLAATVGRLVELGFLTRPGRRPAARRRRLRPGAAAFLHDPRPRAGGRLPRRHRAPLRRQKSVVEIGCGSGILSIFAARAGARRVTAIEESAVAHLAANMFAANGCSELIDLRRGNSRDVELAEKAEVIVHEILGTDPLAENMLFYLRDARRRLLAPGGRLIPYRLEVACVGVELEEKPGPGAGAGACSKTRQFEAAYGLSFGPLADSPGGHAGSEIPAPDDLPARRALRRPDPHPRSQPRRPRPAARARGRPRPPARDRARGEARRPPRRGAGFLQRPPRRKRGSLDLALRPADPLGLGRPPPLQRGRRWPPATTSGSSVAARVERGLERLVVDWP